MQRLVLVTDDLDPPATAELIDGPVDRDPLEPRP